MPTKASLTLQQTIDLGEYQPEVLKQFEEFNQLSRYSQYQLIRKALKIREKQLRLHFAEVANQLDFSQKGYLKTTLKNIQKQIHDLSADEERLLIDYSN